MTPVTHLQRLLCKPQATVLNMFKVWLAASCVLLAACKPELAWNEFAALHFSSAPRGVYYTSYIADNKRYARRLTGELEKLGLKAEDLKIEADSDYRNVLYVSIRQRAFTPEQRGIIRAYLVGILEAREQENIVMKLTLRSGLDPTLPTKRRLPIYDTYISLASMRLRPPFEIEVLSAGTDQGRAVCHISAATRVAALQSFEQFVPLPGSQFQAARGFAMRVKNKTSPDTPPELVIDALLDLQNPSLARQLDEQGIEPYLKLGPRDARAADSLSITSAGFVIGDLDAPQDTELPIGAMEDKCALKIAALGRPFSFHVGYSMDRLQFVEFWDQP